MIVIMKHLILPRKKQLLQKSFHSIFKLVSRIDFFMALEGSLLLVYSSLAATKSVQNMGFLIKPAESNQAMKPLFERHFQV